MKLKYTYNVEVGGQTQQVTQETQSAFATVFDIASEVNDTGSEDDDFIAVSAGTDDDLATNFLVRLDGAAGTSGLSVDLHLMSDGGNTDGAVNFKSSTIDVNGSGEASTKLWGVDPSSDKDETTVVVTVKRGSRTLAFSEEDITVFEGVKIEFDGTFYSPVDMRDYNRRLSDGVTAFPPGHIRAGIVPPTLPIGYSSHADFNEALQEDTKDYTGRIAFSASDQGINMRDWSPAPSVAVKKVMLVNPNVDLTTDPISTAKISAVSGRFFEDLGQGNDLIVDPIFELVSGSESYFKIKVANRSDDTRIFGPYTVDGISAATVKSQMDAAEQSGEADKLTVWWKNWSGTTNNQAYANALSPFSTFGREWQNSSFDAETTSHFDDSVVAKGILAWQEVHGNKSIKCYFKMDSFNEWTLVGKLSEGVLETK